MSTFELSTCYMAREGEPVLPGVLADTVVNTFEGESGRFGVRYMHAYRENGTLDFTNVGVTIFDADFRDARMLQKQLTTTVGKGFGLTQEGEREEENTLGMFTDAGTRALQKELVALGDGLRSGEIPAQKTADAIMKLQDRVAAAGHGEVHDTAVREEIYAQADQVLSEMGLRLI